MNRGQLRTALATGNGLPVILDIRDDVDVLLGRQTDTPIDAQIETCRRIGSRRFILAGTCAILTGTPLENLQAAAAAACR